MDEKGCIIHSSRSKDIVILNVLQIVMLGTVPDWSYDMFKSLTAEFCQPIREGSFHDKVNMTCIETSRMRKIQIKCIYSLK